MRILSILLFIFSISCDGQIPVIAVASGSKSTTPPPTPSAFDDVLGWWDAGHISGSSGSYVLADQSGNGWDMTQAAGTISTGTGTNSQPKITGNSTARLNSSLTMTAWPGTFIVVANRAADATIGFFGHQGASPFNTFFFGYETVNRFAIYNNNSQLNTTAEGGTTSCYTAMIGHGFRVSMLNGDLLPGMTRSTMVGPGTATATTIGTQYRGLNGDFYELLVWDRTLSLDELDEVHSYLNTKYSLSIPLWSSYDEATTLCMGGQSNASGRGDRGVSDANIPAEYDQALTGVNIWYGTRTLIIGSAFETLNVNSNNHMLGDEAQGTTYFGPELTFTKEYLDLNTSPIYVVKYATGGSNMAYSASLNYWHPSVYTTRAHNSQARMYGQFMQNWWTSLRIHQDNGRIPVIKGFFWFQGEQDATNQPDADALSANTQLMFSTIRKEMAVNTDFKILMCRIHINGSETYESTVRTQQADAAANISNCQLIDTDSYMTRPGDGVHLGYQGQLDLGSYAATQTP